MNVLTLDLGTSATKAALWSGTELVELAQVPIPTSHPAPTHAEQDPEDWWSSVVDVCSLMRERDPEAYGAVEVVGFAAARETFACFDHDLTPLGLGSSGPMRERSMKCGPSGTPPSSGAEPASS